MTLHFKPGFLALTFFSLGWTLTCMGQTPQPAPKPGADSQASERSGMDTTGEQPRGSQPSGGVAGAVAGTIAGTIVDESGAFVVGADVEFSGEDPSSKQEVRSDNDGKFYFASVHPGAYHLTIAAAGFATQTVSGVLHAGETETVPQISMQVAEALTEVQVRLTQAEVAEEQIKVEEKQRVVGIVPNFYVSYVPNAAPLTAKQKFKLALWTVVDPVTFVMVGGAAGVEQWQNHFAEYGQGAQGYGKRFGAGYADTVAGTFIGSALLPSVLKQDPRYFYKGTGSMPSRFTYAVANALICKGDNGRWQVNYSNILGNLAAGGISNLYYPRQDRNGAGLTLENAAIGIGGTAITNVIQEFILRKLTPKVPRSNLGKPQKLDSAN